MEHNFQPLLFGGDINVYSVARAFHEAYGIQSVCYGKFASGPAYGSTIIDYRVCPQNEDAATFRENVAKAAQEFADKTVLVIGCGDSYVQLAARYKDQMPANAIARICSAVVNYRLNKSFVFQLKECKGAAGRYALLSVCVLLCSNLAQGLLGAVLPAWFNPTILKALVDTVLYFVNYRIQRAWVFPQANEG